MLLGKEHILNEDDNLLLKTQSSIGTGLLKNEISAHQMDLKSDKSPNDDETKELQLSTSNALELVPPENSIPRRSSVDSSMVIESNLVLNTPQNGEMINLDDENNADFVQHIDNSITQLQDDSTLQITPMRITPNRRRRDSMAINKIKVSQREIKKPSIRYNDIASDRFDFVIFMGDLNYRVNGTRAAVDSLIQTKMFGMIY